MGEFKFRIPADWQLEPRLLRTVHVIGLDGIPGACRVRVEDQLLIVTRNQNESGRTYIAYPFTNGGELTVCTGTLPETNRPYHLVAELARGTLNRLRNQTAIWEEGGLAISQSVRQWTQQATLALSQAVTGDDEQRDNAARASLDLTMEAILALSHQFGQRISTYRVSQKEIPAFWMAAAQCHGQAGDGEFGAAFDLIESLADHEAAFNSHKGILGPLLDASPAGAFSAGEQDFKARRHALLQSSRCDLQKISSATSLIHVACGLNGVGHQRLGYRQQMQVTTDLLNLVDDLGLKQPVMVSFENPWAEKLAWSVGGLHPLQIADELMRGGAPISCIGLDINLDYWPTGSLSRDPLQWIDMFDIWCQFGLPLILCLRIPQTVAAETAGNDGPNSMQGTSENGFSRVKEKLKTTLPSDDSTPPAVVNSIRDTLSSKQRLDLIETVLPMAIARPGLHGIIWRQWSDVDDPRFPEAGMVDACGGVKPIGQLLKQLRQDVLQR